MDDLIKALKDGQAELKAFAVGEAVQLSELCDRVLLRFDEEPKNKGCKHNVKAMAHKSATFLQAQNTNSARQAARQLWAELYKLGK